MTVHQKVPNLYFQSKFWMSEINQIFKKISKNINSGDHYLLKTFFSKLNFWTTLLSKITPNFWQTVITRRNFLNIFPWWHVDSWPKSLLFMTHHLGNSTTELILNWTAQWFQKCFFLDFRRISCWQKLHQIYKSTWNNGELFVEN